MQLRMLEEADLKPLSKLYTHYAIKTVYTYYAYEASPRYMRSLFSGRGHACAVAVEDGKVIGYVHVSPSPGKREYCALAVYLDPDHVGQRRGETLVRYGEMKAADLGYSDVIIGICTENTRSTRLFERLGYRHTHTQEAETVKFGRALDTAYYCKSMEDKEHEEI